MRPLWSAGIACSPLVWHIRQSARPSSVCGIAVGPPVGAVGAVGVVGVVGTVGVVGGGGVGADS